MGSQNWSHVRSACIEVFGARGLRVQDGFQGTERYKVLDLLGTGGMGAVYHAYDAVRDRSVALKLMRIRGSEEQIAFKREFRNIESLKHPNLVRLFELEETGDARTHCCAIVAIVNVGLELLAKERRRLDPEGEDRRRGRVVPAVKPGAPAGSSGSGAGAPTSEPGPPSRKE